MKCIISCEHASNLVPSQYSYLFNGMEDILSSHQAYDPGTADLASSLADRLNATVHLGTISRLLIDLNRSPTNRRSLFSAHSRKLKAGERDMLLTNFYYPYRKKVEREVDMIIAQEKKVLHISVHSFTPVRNGKERKAEIGLLYDPARKVEKKLSVVLAETLREKENSLRVRRNYPYLGKTDGFTSYLRKKYSAKLYAGIEIEMNQALLMTGDHRKKRAADVLNEGISSILKLKDFSCFLTCGMMEKI